jgi:hypothetical protein
MKTRISAFVIAMLITVPAFAADSVPQPKAPGQNFEQHKAEVIARIDQRIARRQEEKGCVQAAKNAAEIKACRDRFKDEIKSDLQKKQ